MSKGPNNTHDWCFVFDCFSPCKCNPYRLTLTHKHSSLHDPQQQHNASLCNSMQHLDAPMITEPYPTACIQDYKTVQHAYDPMTRTAATCCNIRSWFRHDHRRTVGQDEKDFDVWEVIILRQALDHLKRFQKHTSIRIPPFCIDLHWTKTKTIFRSQFPSQPLFKKSGRIRRTLIRFNHHLHCH